MLLNTTHFLKIYFISINYLYFLLHNCKLLLKIVPTNFHKSRIIKLACKIKDFRKGNDMKRLSYVKKDSLTMEEILLQLYILFCISFLSLDFFVTMSAHTKLCLICLELGIYKSWYSLRPLLPNSTLSHKIIKHLVVIYTDK